MKRLLHIRQARPWTAAAILIFGIIIAGAAMADDHDRAREALQRGEILPLSEVLRIAEDVQQGNVLEVELEQDHRQWIYELKMLTPDGWLLNMEIDAATGRLIEIEREDN